jgi:hypothetical protein
MIDERIARQPDSFEDSPESSPSKARLLDRVASITDPTSNSRRTVT